jgi:plasmid maintenance system antidote protein VapI
MMNDWKSSIHPGEILADELEEIDLTISQLAQKIYVSPETLYHIWFTEHQILLLLANFN